MKFQPGESVVCINDDFAWAKGMYAGITWPVRGRCYVVRGYACKGKWPAILLREIRNRKVGYSDGVIREAGFLEDRFERAPKIDDIKKIAADVDMWMGASEEVSQPEKEDA